MLGGEKITLQLIIDSVQFAIFCHDCYNSATFTRPFSHNRIFVISSVTDVNIDNLAILLL